MRILVVSDSHGDFFTLNKIIENYKDVSEVFFLGDGETDIDSVMKRHPEKEFHCVRGNCDFSSKKDIANVVKICGKKILYAHGHTYYVKSSTEDLLFTAKVAKANIVLHGHTHIPKIEYSNGLYIICPGSSRGSTGTFAIIDIEKNGILPMIIKNSTLNL